MGELLDFGRQVLTQEIEGIQQLVGLLDENFEAAAKEMIACSGHVVIAGVGKPWLIGQKISATLASTGTPSFALHPSEAIHGDLGRLREHDLVIVLSNSGTSVEIVQCLSPIKRIGCRVIAVTGNMDSPLAKVADVILDLGKVSEACPIGMAPSVSTTTMLALGDALSLAVMKERSFGRAEYARFHPGGALGRSLMLVSDVMRPLDDTAVVDAGASVVDALNEITTHRTGAVFVVEANRLVGVFTDGDLRRHIQDENLLSQPISEVMTDSALNVRADALATEAVHIIQERKIGELPVVDQDLGVLGHVALKDLVSMHFL